MIYIYIIIYLIGFIITYIWSRYDIRKDTKRLNKKYEWEDVQKILVVSFFSWIILIPASIAVALSRINFKLPKFPKYPPKWL